MKYLRLNKPKLHKSIHDLKVYTSDLRYSLEEKSGFNTLEYYCLEIIDSINNIRNFKYKDMDLFSDVVDLIQQYSDNFDSIFKSWKNMKKDIKDLFSDLNESFKDAADNLATRYDNYINARTVFYEDFNPLPATLNLLGYYSFVVVQ